MLIARYVLAIKSKIDGNVKFKARYVFGGHKNVLKNYLVHGACFVATQSVRLMIALAAILGFRVWSTDVKLAYLKSTEQLKRPIFIKNPAPEF